MKGKQKQSLVSSAHPAVQILPLLGLPHPLDISGEDAEESRQHGFGLRPGGVFGEKAVHDGGAFDNQPGDVLQRAASHVSTAVWTANRMRRIVLLLKLQQLAVITRARSL